MDKQERWTLRVPATQQGEKFITQLKQYLNKDSYKVSKMYTGPRPKGTSPYATRKENATSVRLYVDSKMPNDQLPIWVNVMRENANLKMRLDNVHVELTKAQSLLDWRN